MDLQHAYVFSSSSPSLDSHLGVGILWIGLNGFNGGDPYAASTDAGAAVLNTNVCTAMSSLTWVLMDIIFYKKPSVVSAVQGMITGLVTITPAAGLVTGWGAIVMIGLGIGSLGHDEHRGQETHVLP